MVKAATIGELLADLERYYTLKRKASRRNLTGHIDAILDAEGDEKGRVKRDEQGNAKYPSSSLKNVPAAHLTTAAWNRLVTKWQAAGRADQTINCYRSTLLSALRLAAKSKPPKLAAHMIPELTKLEIDNTREGFFERGDFLAVMEHIEDEHLCDFMEWAYLTGQRKTEIANMTWAMFDHESWTLSLPGRITKNRKAKKFVLSGAFREVIERRLRARRLDAPWVFWRLHEGRRTARLEADKPAPIYEFRKTWASACKKAGLTGRFFHDFRRTGVRNLVRAGVPRADAMKISGHRTESVFERYNIGGDDDLREAAEKLTAYVESLPTKRKVEPLPAAGAR